MLTLAMAHPKSLSGTGPVCGSRETWTGPVQLVNGSSRGPQSLTVLPVMDGK